MKEQDRCAYLDADGRCRIHDVRPGICRLFPLGRVYDDKGDFSYFLQTGECAKKNLAKIKVKKVDMLAMPGEEPGICHGVACIDPHSRTEDGGT